jgi:hypothetical protein
MGLIRTRIGRPRRAFGALVLGISMAVFAALPTSAPATPNGDLPKAALEEFRGLCADLTEARDRLATGTLDEESFADTLLALFVRADSLAARLASGPAGNPSLITLQRGTAYLIDSLRDNWIGIRARNGVSFAEADLALKAAIAWRSNASNDAGSADVAGSVIGTP